MEEEDIRIFLQGNIRDLHNPHLLKDGDKTYGNGRCFRMSGNADNKKMQTKEEAYNEYVKRVTPKSNLLLNMVKAFLVGGIICTIGQVISTLFMNNGLDKDTANSWTLVILIATTVILTGFNIFPKIAKFGGAGALVPITGFANSVVSPAIEYKKEGQVFGIGCKIFTIAGPVILYGILSSWVFGLIYWIGKMWGWF